MAENEATQELERDSDYTVKSGDNLWKIARSLGFSQEEFIEMNLDKYPSLKDNPNLIQPGWEFKTQREIPETGTYTVQNGDNLTNIANSFGTDVDTLVKLNQDAYKSLKNNPDHIEPGWKINVVKPEPIPAPTPPSDVAPDAQSQAPQTPSTPNVSDAFEAIARPEDTAPTPSGNAPTLPQTQIPDALMSTPQNPPPPEEPAVVTTAPSDIAPDASSKGPQMPAASSESDALEAITPKDETSAPQTQTPAPLITPDIDDAASPETRPLPAPETGVESGILEQPITPPDNSPNVEIGKIDQTPAHTSTQPPPLVTPGFEDTLPGTPQNPPPPEEPAVVTTAPSDIAPDASSKGPQMPPASSVSDELEAITPEDETSAPQTQTPAPLITPDIDDAASPETRPPPIPETGVESGILEQPITPPDNSPNVEIGKIDQTPAQTPTQPPPLVTPGFEGTLPGTPQNPPPPERSTAPAVDSDSLNQPKAPTIRDEALNLPSTLTTPQPIVNLSPALQAPSDNSEEAQQTYIVKSGDTLDKIATQFGVDTETLIKLNQDTYRSLLANKHHIEEGWTLSVSKPASLADILPNIEENTSRPKAHDIGALPIAPSPDNQAALTIPAPHAPPNIQTPTALGMPPSTSDAFNMPSNRDERLARLSANVWDHIKTGEPIVTQAAASNKSNTLIIIDLGHNAGGDPDAVSNYNQLSETDVVDPVGAALAEKLEAQGLDVLLTRNPGERLQGGFTTRDTEIGPNNDINDREARADFATLATQHGGYANSILISLHADSEHTGTAQGFAAFAASRPNGNGMVDLGRPAIDPLARQLTNTLAANMSGRTRTNTLDATVIARYERNSPAEGVHVASLIELGFLSNKSDAERLKEVSENPQSMAQEIASGIMNFYQNIIQPKQDVTIAALKDAPSPIPH